MKKLMIGLGFAAMLSLFTAVSANANGYNGHENSRQPNRAQNERGMADRREAVRHEDQRFDRHEDRSRFDRGPDRERFARNDNHRGAERHYDEHQYRGWR